MASMDLSARIYHRVRSRKMATTVLSGHRGPLVGAFFAMVHRLSHTPCSCVWKLILFMHTATHAPRGTVPRRKRTRPGEPTRWPGTAAYSPGHSKKSTPTPPPPLLRSVLPCPVLSSILYSSSSRRRKIMDMFMYVCAVRLWLWLFCAGGGEGERGRQ